MSGVGITGKIKPKDGGAFPVWEDIDGEGGYRSVATIGDRNTFSAAPLYCKTGMLCYVETLQCVYELAPDLTTWNFYAPSPRLSLQTDWYVSTTGDVNADGKTLGAAITQEELQRRLFPRASALMMTNDVTIHFAAGTYFTQLFNAATASATSTVFNLILDYEISSSAEMTLTGVVQTVASTKQRGRLTVAAGTFVDRERIRLTTGANAGAMTYSSGLVAANPLDTYVDLFGPSSFAQFHIPLPATVGDKVVVDTLLCSVSRLEVIAHPRVRVTVKSARIVRAIVNGVPTETPSADQGGNVLFAGCAAISTAGYWITNAGGAMIGACRWEPNTKTTLKGQGWLIIGLSAQGWLGIIGTASSYGLTINGGALVIGAEFTLTYAQHSGPGYLHTARGYVGGGSLEVENGPGSGVSVGLGAVTIMPGSEMVVGDFADCEQWGNSTPYATGYVIWPGAHIYQHNSQPGTLLAIFGIPSVVNINCGGELFDYSDNEISIPNQNCGLLATGSVNNLISYTDAQLYLTGQSANLAATNFGPTGQSFAATPGLYQVSGYVSVTTADAAATGTPTINILFTDDSGIARTAPVVTGPALTALGGTGSEIIIESSLAADYANIRWSISGITSIGTALFSVRLRVEKLSSGA